MPLRRRQSTVSTNRRTRNSIMSRSLAASSTTADSAAKEQQQKHTISNPLFNCVDVVHIYHKQYPRQYGYTTKLRQNNEAMATALAANAILEESKYYHEDYSIDNTVSWYFGDENDNTTTHTTENENHENNDIDNESEYDKNNCDELNDDDDDNNNDADVDVDVYSAFSTFSPYSSPLAVAAATATKQIVQKTKVRNKKQRNNASRKITITKSSIKAKSLRRNNKKRVKSNSAGINGNNDNSTTPSTRSSSSTKSRNNTERKISKQKLTNPTTVIKQFARIDNTNNNSALRNDESTSFRTDDQHEKKRPEIMIALPTTDTNNRNNATKRRPTLKENFMKSNGIDGPPRSTMPRMKNTSNKFTNKGSTFSQDDQQKKNGKRSISVATTTDNTNNNNNNSNVAKRHHKSKTSPTKVVQLEKVKKSINANERDWMKIRNDVWAAYGIRDSSGAQNYDQGVASSTTMIKEKKLFEQRFNDDLQRHKPIVLRGITQRPSDKWQAQIYYKGKSRYIGVFNSQRDAAVAYELCRSRIKTKKR